MSRLVKTMCLALAVVLLCLGSCADSGGPSAGGDRTECKTDQDCDAGWCMEGQCVLDDPQDTGGDGDPYVETREDPPEVDDVQDDQPDPLGVGDPCDQGSDCPSGHCIEVGNGQRVCTDFCVEGSCPDEWVCAPVENSGADRVFLCFPEVDFLCAPCDGDAACGGLSDLCLDYEDGQYCARNCSVQACPEGFDCVEMEIDGRLKHQCRARDHGCSPCWDPDDDGHGEGPECLGFDCDEADSQRNSSAEVP